MMDRRSLGLGIIAAFLALGSANGAEKKKKTKKKPAAKKSGGAKSFSSCKAAKKAGYSHMRVGQPGYSKRLDRDGDGVACDK